MLSGQGYEQCVVLDIGVDGACLRVHNPLPPDQALEVDFELSHDWLVKTTAQILWQKPDGEDYLVGVRYRPKRSADRNLMGPWIHRQRRLQS